MIRDRKKKNKTRVGGMPTGANSWRGQGGESFKQAAGEWGRLYAADLVTIGSVGHSELGASGTT